MKTRIRWNTGSGELPPSSDSVDELIVAARAESDAYVPVVGPDSYERLVPDIFGFVSSDESMKRYMMSVFAQACVPTPPEEIYLLRDAYVAALPLVFTREQTPFTPSLVDHDRVHPFDFFVDLAGGAIPEVDAPTIFIFKAGSANYGHILVEMLPKLENVFQLFDEPMRVLVPPLPGSLVGQLHDLLARLYPGKFIVQPMHAPIMRVRELIYPGPVSRHNARKSRTLSRFADRVRDLVTPASPARLYVSREGHTNRRMTNEAEVRACFETYGFRAVRPEVLTLLRQAELFASATHVAGPLGAGLSNIVFAGPRLDVFMIDPSLNDFFFWDLACLRGQHFTWYFSSPVARFEVDRLHTDYSVPVAPLRETLESLWGLGLNSRRSSRRDVPPSPFPREGCNFSMTLNELGLRHGTDKSSEIHDYLNLYERRFRDLRDKAFVMIEVGVLRGASVHMWGEYFPKARIVGIDFDPDCGGQEGENISIRIGDASSVDFLFDVVQEFGKPLIVIDDGSHRWDHQIVLLQTLFPLLLPGGFFVVEDLDTSFERHLATAAFQGYSKISAFDYLCKLARRTVADAAFGNEEPYDLFIEKYHQHVGSVEFGRRTCIVSKKPTFGGGPT